MNTKTGAIMLISDENTPPPDVVRLARHPKSTCRKCHGRGHVGRNVLTGDFTVCRCTMKPIDKAAKMV